MKTIVKQLAKDHDAIFRVLMSGDNQVVFTEDDLYRFSEALVNKCIAACLESGEVFHFLPASRKQIALDCANDILTKMGLLDGKA